MEEPLMKPLSAEQEGAAGKILTWEVLVEELKQCCYIALPMVVVSVSQNLLRFISMSMVGHLGELELAGAAIATSLTKVTGFSVLVTYTGGAIISLLIVCLPISILWLFMDKLFIFIGQDPSISAEARIFSVRLIPTLLPYAILQLLIRHLQTQSLVFPLLWISVAALIFHVPVCWAWFSSLD